jgi:hypothetical protein
MCSRLQKRVASGRTRTETEKARNKLWSVARAFVEHPFHDIKQLCGFVKVRYHGSPKTQPGCLRSWRSPISIACDTDSCRKVVIRPE